MTFLKRPITYAQRGGREQYFFHFKNLDKYVDVYTAVIEVPRKAIFRSLLHGVKTIELQVYISIISSSLFTVFCLAYSLEVATKP